MYFLYSGSPVCTIPFILIDIGKLLDSRVTFGHKIEYINNFTIFRMGYNYYEHYTMHFLYALHNRMVLFSESLHTFQLKQQNYIMQFF